MIRRRPSVVAAVAAAAALGVAGTVWAQIEGGDRGVAAVDSSSDYEVGNVDVDTTGPNADAARLAGWREAQRKAWARLSQRLGAGGAAMPDGTLDSVVSSIVVQNEQIGPNRYVARLGVLFNRQRAAALLGVALYATRSPPMVVIPVVWLTGVGTAFEQRTAWQEAWARYRTANSEIDYIRPPGNGPDPLLLNVGQAGRPARGWWRKVLDQYGGTDVLVPTVLLARQWPGGPIVATFQVRHGPDNRILDQFALRVRNAQALPALLDAGVQRMDGIYQDALRSGLLQPDTGLNPSVPAAAEVPAVATDPLAGLFDAAPITIYQVQYDSPDAGTVDATERALRIIPGVASANTSSLALGGVSAASVGFAGPPDLFRAALEAGGFQVAGSGTVVRIRRAPQLPPPDPRPDASPAG